MSNPSDIWITRWNDDVDKYHASIFYDDFGQKPKIDEKCLKAIPLESEDVPEYLFLKKDRPVRPPLKEVYTIMGGVPIIRRDLKEILERFDLGNTRFFPREILKADRKTVFSDEYFVVSIAETKNLGVIEGSDVKVFPPGFVSLDYAERIFVRREDPPTTDMWLDEGFKYVGVLFSDRLYQAIKAAGFKKLKFRKTFAPSG
ncbi:MAG: hypothetical protein AAGF76_02345 [Pseudomonadota bacterium]